jgi:hypothetical protein
MIKFKEGKLTTWIVGGVFAVATTMAASAAFSQTAAPSGAPADNSGAPTTSSDSSGSASITHPQPGANNDPALAEPKAGPTGAPGVATESGSPDANGVHSNVAMPLPSPAK